MSDSAGNNSDARKEQASFYLEAMRSPVFPFTGNGLWIMLSAAIVLPLTILGLSALWIFGLGLLLIIAVYLTGYISQVVVDTAGGEDEAPNWPDFSDFIEECFWPTLMALGAILVAFAPWIIAALAGADSLIRSVLGAVGAAYLPMALTAAVLFRSIEGLNPFLVVRSIFKTLPKYIFAAVLVVLVFLAMQLAQDFMRGQSLLLSMIGPVVGLYFYIVQARIMGLIYRYCEDELDWFGTSLR